MAGLRDNVQESSQCEGPSIFRGHLEPRRINSCLLSVKEYLCFKFKLLNIEAFQMKAKFKLPTFKFTNDFQMPRCAERSKATFQPLLGIFVCVIWTVLRMDIVVFCA